jgi:hypothetical protein
MADPNVTAQPGRAGDNSTGELVRNLSEQVSRLIRDELKLAEYEMTTKAKRFGRGAGMFGGSGLFALYGLAALLAAAGLGLALVLPGWAAALIVGGALLVLAGLVALIGKGQLGKATPAVPQQTVASVRADVEEIKERVHR